RSSDLGRWCQSSAVREPVLEILARPEVEHATRRNRHFHSGLRIAADALALVAQNEAAEAGDLDVLSVGHRLAHLGQNGFDQRQALGARETHLAIDGLSQIGPGESAYRSHHWPSNLPFAQQIGRA